MSNEPDAATLIRKELTDFGDALADDDKVQWLARVDAAKEDLSALVELFKEALDEEGGCDHSVGICACSSFGLLDKALIELGEARWCECNDVPCCYTEGKEGEADNAEEGCCPSRLFCPKCHGMGIIYLPYAVGCNDGKPLPTGEKLRRFPTHDEAAEFIGTLPAHQDGIYYLDGPEQALIREVTPCSHGYTHHDCEESQ